VNVCVSDAPRLSVAVNVTELVPAPVGVPEINPVELIEMPDGRPVPVVFQVTVPVPPVEVAWIETIARPLVLVWFAVGPVMVVAALTTQLNDWVSTWPALSVTVKRTE
jgi:hypothetical protein